MDTSSRCRQKTSNPKPIPSWPPPIDIFGLQFLPIVHSRENYRLRDRLICDETGVIFEGHVGNCPVSSK